VDVSALNQLGMCLHIYFTAQEQLLKEGILIKCATSSTMKQNPLLKIVNEQNAKITRYYLEFGMTPSSRLRQGKELDEEPSTFDLMMKEMNKIVLKY
jgi:P27 family predicted phage terminase small subunit